MHFKSLFRSINVMNAALLAILIVVAAHEFPSFFHIQAKFIPPSPGKNVAKEEKAVEAQPSSPAEYTIIAEQNIFHPERKIPVVTAVAPPLPKPEFVLYGTLLAGDVNLAYMEDLKGSGGSAKKRQRAIKKGETISGFILQEIETEKVVMVRGEEKIEVRVTDKPRSKGNGAVTTTQGSSATNVSRPGQQPAVASGSGSASAQTSADTIRRRREALRNASGNLREQRQRTIQQNPPK